MAHRSTDPHPPSRFLRALLAGLVLAATVVACGGEAAPAATSAVGGLASASPAGVVSTGAPSAATPPLPSLPAADPAAVEELAGLIAAASLDDEATLRALDGRRFDEGAPEAAQAALAAGAQGDARWAAAWVYASSGTDVAVLQPLLTDPDPSIRAIAAGALVSWGDAAAIPVLVQLMAEPGLLAGSVPPAPVAAFAGGTLDRLVDAEIAPGVPTPADAPAAWEAWLTDNEGRLAFDPASGTWSAR